MNLSSDQKAFWDQNGFLVLPGFFSDQEINAVEDQVRAVWKECPSNVLVDDIVVPRRLWMSELTDQDKEHHFKVMDLYLEYPLIRNTALHGRLVPLLSDLVYGPPVLGAVLNFEKGSQQEYHADSLFLTPETQGHLIATWIALENTHPDAGALQYFPGSHVIPPFRFSDGGTRSIPSEMENWKNYMMSEIEKRGLKSTTFMAKKGDVFIWHSDLVHGGAPINNHALTRKSMVSHYFSLKDSKALGRKLIPLNGGYWHDRPPVGTNKQLSDIVVGAKAIRKLAHALLPSQARSMLKGALRRVFGIQ